MIALLRVIPIWVYIVAACLAWGGYQRWRANSAAQEYAQAQAAAATEREAALQAAIEETARRLAAQAKATKDADEQTAKAKTAAAGAAGAAQRLRAQLAAFAASATSSDPAASGAGATSGLAEILGECADRYRTVAVAADRAVIAGRACEQIYDSLASPRGSGSGPN